MTSRDELRGRVALPTGEALVGFTVELRTGDSSPRAVTDGLGEFHLLRPPEVAVAAAAPVGLLVVRAPNNQEVLRDHLPLDGRYLGLTVPRDALPSLAGPDPTSLMSDQPAAADPVEPADVGASGEISLSGALQERGRALDQVTGVGSLLVLTAGSQVFTGTLDPTSQDRLLLTHIDLDGEQLDLAGDPFRGQAVILRGASDPGDAGELVTLDELGRLESRRALHGDWDRLAISERSGSLVLARAPDVVDWSPSDGEPELTLEVPGVVDIAFVGEFLLVATTEDLLMFGPDGEVRSRTPSGWGRRLRLVEAGVDTVYVYDGSSGSASRFRADGSGVLRADLAVAVGRDLTLGWWWGRSWMLARRGARLRWWRLPPPPPDPVHQDSSVTLLGSARFDRG
jgi:hypothetical protein